MEKDKFFRDLILNHFKTEGCSMQSQIGLLCKIGELLIDETMPPKTIETGMVMEELLYVLTHSCLLETYVQSAVAQTGDPETHLFITLKSNEEKNNMTKLFKYWANMMTFMEQRYDELPGISGLYEKKQMGRYAQTVREMAGEMLEAIAEGGFLISTNHTQSLRLGSLECGIAIFGEIWQNFLERFAEVTVLMYESLIKFRSKNP